MNTGTTTTKTNKKQRHTVESVKASGAQVKVIHYRAKEGTSRLIPRNQFKDSFLMKAKGGKTEVIVTLPNGLEAQGVARCHSQEGFNRKISLNVALGRAMKQLATAGQEV